MAKWEPKVENYLGFPRGGDGNDLLKFGRQQAQRYGAEFLDDEIVDVKSESGGFFVRSRRSEHQGGRLLLAAGIFHLPPEINGMNGVTPANCQMIIAAGQGATAAQAINRDLFEESLRIHQLRRFRDRQLREEETVPKGADKPGQPQENENGI